MTAYISMIVIGGALLAGFLGIFLGKLSQRNQKLKHEPLKIIFNKRSPPSELGEPLEIVRCRKLGNIFGALLCLVLAAAAGLALFAKQADTSIIFVIIPTLASVYNLGLATRSVHLYRDGVGFRHFGREKAHYLADLDCIEVCNIANSFGRVASFGYRFVADGKEIRALTTTDFPEIAVLESIYDLRNPNVAQVLSGDEATLP